MDCALCAVPAADRTELGGWFVSTPGGDAPIAGWIALATVAHRETLDELSATEADALGPLLKQLSAAIMAETGAERTYVANWAEGTRHVHFHVIPRLPALAADRLGADVFGLMSDDLPHPSRVEQERVLRAVLDAVPSPRVAAAS